MDDNGPWYKCKCGQTWQAPNHPKPKECPECQTDLFTSQIKEK